MKSTSQAGLILVLIMFIIVLASLFWFLYSDYDAVREQADKANSRATRVAVMEEEAGQLRAEADQIQATRAVLEGELATAVYSQETLEQESVNDQQTIQALETRAAGQVSGDSIPEVIIISPTNGASVNLADSVEVVVAAFDPNGIRAINLVFDSNPPLEILVGGEVSKIVREPWPISDSGEHTAVVTAVNSNNISSQTTSITITAENKLTSQQIIDEVTNIIGPLSTEENATNEIQVSTEGSEFRAEITPLLLQAFDFAATPDVENGLDWGVYCEAASGQSLATATSSQEAIDSPAKELALVQATIREWQESQYQFSQQLAEAPHDDARAALCALAAGHERWVMEEYIKRAPEERQALLTDNLTPLTGVDNSTVLAAQQTVGTTYGPAFFKAIVDSTDTTAVLNAWNRPPQSTAQILNPPDYTANNAPQDVLLPDLTTFLGDDWNPVVTNVLGAFMLQKYLENYGETTEIETAVSGWQGDKYSLYQQGENGPILLALHINWAANEDAQEFAAAYERYVNGRFSGTVYPVESPENSNCWRGTSAETICIFTAETQTVIVRAPEDNLAVTTLAEMIEP
ncbi:MAG: hypothetical protein IAF02_00055 [Anaerolineae bacterium]|nr:hypothetical protein [Anaerolineae bacterium]